MGGMKAQLYVKVNISNFKSLNLYLGEEIHMKYAFLNMRVHNEDSVKWTDCEEKKPYPYYFNVWNKNVVQDVDR